MFSRLTPEKGMRSIGLAFLDSDLCDGDMLHVDIRGKMTPAVLVPYHLRSEAPPLARAYFIRQALSDGERSGPFAQE